MLYYAGLDVSMKNTYICIMDETGQKAFESKCYTDPQSISECLTSSGYKLEKVGLESGSLSGYLTKGLKRLGVPALCLDVRKMAAILSVTINKTDKNDARGIADALRCNHYKEVHLKDEDEEAMGVLLKSRKNLVEIRVTLKNTIRGFLKIYGIRQLSTGSSLFIDQVRSRFDQLPPYALEGIKGLVKMFKEICDQIGIFEKEIKKISSQTPQVKQLMSIPGVGVLVATNFITNIGDPNRFKKSSSVGAYFGMTPNQYSSGETVRQGRISKCGSRAMRGLLYEAGVVLLTRTTFWFPLKSWGARLIKKHGLKKAAMAVGRKLSVIMHRMLLTGELFNYKKEINA